MATKTSKRTQSKATPAEGERPGRKHNRNYKRTPEVRKLLEEAIGDLGFSDRSACDYAGLHHDTFYEWLREDSDMSDAIMRARAKFKQLHTRNVASAGPADWRASAWLLSHRFPEEYAERQMIDANVQTASPLDKLFAPPLVADTSSEPITNGQREDDSPDS